MRVVGAIVRLLMFVACLVPCTSQRQDVGLFAPYVLPTAVPITTETPAGGEDDERAGSEKERLAASSRHRFASGKSGDFLPLDFATHPARFACIRATPPVAADPFRNGLGTHYRC